MPSLPSPPPPSSSATRATGLRGRERRPRRATAYAWANDGHVPRTSSRSTRRITGNHVLYESKVYTPIKTSDNLGNDSKKGGGSASTAAGNLVGMGCTEEKLL
eukprot:2081168-Prymnesium_polylepis.1